ncbi:hypothetical protein SAMN05216386_2082 [Nitrosospira briensis]|uniref:Uncharacterized protein n=1 Tax=Nitrosospira briensis TaxID=35799 RepID=A0A1I5CPX0_9PROT|nr:hypothetical protein SAMN05216386_2082 [Nitrosospira briensis]SFO11009.1 hypothetical protein SAMN05216332_10590 [Nitrosospira briensis]
MRLAGGNKWSFRCDRRDELTNIGYKEKGLCFTLPFVDAMANSFLWLILDALRGTKDTDEIRGQHSRGRIKGVHQCAVERREHSCRTMPLFSY